MSKKSTKSGLGGSTLERRAIFIESLMKWLDVRAQWLHYVVSGGGGFMGGRLICMAPLNYPPRKSTPSSGAARTSVLHPLNNDESFDTNLWAK